MDVHKDYPCDRRNYQKGRSGPVKYIVLHYVGALGGAEANCKYYGREKVGASAHYFVDHGPGAGIWSSVAEGDTAWHCGTTKWYRHPECRNANSIGIELCCHQDAAGKWYFDPQTVDRVVELVLALMGKYHIGPENVVRHYDVTGKSCPAPWVEDPAAWEGFKQRLEENGMSEEQMKAMVKEAVGQALAEYETAQVEHLNRPVSAWAARQWEKAQAVGILDGTRPNAPLTREQAAMVLDRLGLLK